MGSIEKIISGGQTGADRAALDFAMNKSIPYGGWIPKGRLTEDGPLDTKYMLKETKSSNYDERTERNILESDATLIFCRGELSGGSLFTLSLSQKHQRHAWVVDLGLQRQNFLDVHEVRNWLNRNRVKTLNIAGARASKDPRIYQDVTKYLGKLLP